MLVLRRGCYYGDGGGGGGGGGRAGGKMQQQVTVWAFNVEGLSAVFTAARLLFSPEVLKCLISRRGISLGRTGSCRLGKDAWGKFNCGWDDRVAALQWMPGGGVGGFRG